MTLADMLDPHWWTLWRMFGGTMYFIIVVWVCKW